MRLSKDASAGGRAIDVPCVECGHRFRLADGWADLDGKAFEAYYCQACADKYPAADRLINGFSVETLREKATCPSPNGYKLERWEAAKYALRNYGLDRT